MSYEAFRTVASCDMRTAPDGRSVLYAEAGSGTPRWNPPHGKRGWVTAYLYAHNAVELAARAVESEPLDGISGDLPELRVRAAAILRSAAEVVKELAADAAGDGQLTVEDWTAALAEVKEAVDG